MVGICLNGWSRFTQTAVERRLQYWIVSAALQRRVLVEMFVYGSGDVQLVLVLAEEIELGKIRRRSSFYAGRSWPKPRGQCGTQGPCWCWSSTQEHQGTRAEEFRILLRDDQSFAEDGDGAKTVIRAIVKLTSASPLRRLRTPRFTTHNIPTKLRQVSFVRNGLSTKPRYISRPSQTKRVYHQGEDA